VDASVIIVDWRRPDLTRKALDAVVGQRTSASFEVVLVVNEAEPAVIDAYRADYPSVVLVPEPTNAGFAGGVARGLAAAGGDIVVLVNNDAVADHTFLDRGLAVLAAVPEDVAALSATVVLEGSFVPATERPDRNDLVTADGGRWRRADRGAPLLNGTGVVLTADGNGRDRDWLRPLDGPRERAPLFGFSGGAAFIRRSALDRVGGFDESLFMYYEDVDLSWRLRLAGYDIRHAADASVVHRHAASSSSDSSLVRYQSMRNRLAVVLRNASGRMVARVVMRTVLRMVVDLVRPAHAQLPPAAWGRLVREAPAIVRRAVRLRRADRVAPQRRAAVERDHLERAAGVP